VIPVFVLNKLSEKLGPGNALILALMFPLGYGIYDWIYRKKINAISALGLLNVTITGGLALLGLGGIWFSLKEAAFPLLIGIFVWFSANSENPFIKMLLINPQVMHVDKIESKLKELNNQSLFMQHLSTSTRLLALSFFISAVFNFTLAQFIFLPLPEGLPQTEKSLLLNQQIAQMTSWSFLVIMVPSMLFLIFIFYHLLNGIKKLTQLTMEDIVRN
jgi:hypothetical protein